MIPYRNGNGHVKEDIVFNRQALNKIRKIREETSDIIEDIDHLIEEIRAKMIIDDEEDSDGQ